jgi:RHS repeat-associated protein
LGYRGELEFDGAVWLRNRVYDPGTRAFLSPDPLAPVLGTACAANPYHYAANDPVGLLDPLGLRPLSENELAEIHKRMAGQPGWLGVVSSFWTGVGVDFLAATLQGVAPWAMAAYATRVSGYVRAGTMVSGHWRRTPSGGRVWVSPHFRSGGSVSSYLRGNSTTQAWGRVGRVAGPLGTIFSGIAGGIDQHGEDADRRGLSTTDRVGRTGGAAAGSAGLSLAGGLGGAWLGARGGAAVGGAIGSVIPGAGTAAGGVVGGTVGAIGGGIVGSGAGSWVADQVSEGFATGGQAAANTAVGAWDATEGVRDTAGGVLHSINPFDD